MINLKKTLRLAALLSCALVATEALAAVFYSNATVVGVTATGVTALQTDLNSTSSLTHTATFDFGPTASYGTVVAGSTGANNVTPFFNGTISSVAITGLTCGTTYHYRVVVAGVGDVDHTFTTSACGAPVPTLSEWGTIVMSALMMGVMALALRKRLAQ